MERVDQATAMKLGRSLQSRTGRFVQEPSCLGLG